MTVQDSTAAAPGPGRAFEAHAALDPIGPETGKAKKVRPPKAAKVTWRSAFRKDWQRELLRRRPPGHRAPDWRQRGWRSAH